MSQAQVIEPNETFVLPSGKELKLHDVLRFCYGLSETEVRVLMTLLKSSPKMTQDLEQELQVSKAIVNRSLNKLLQIGLIKRTKGTEKRYGRPTYIYYVAEDLMDKLTKEIEACTNAIKNVIMTQLTPAILA